MLVVEDIVSAADESMSSSSSEELSGELSELVTACRKYNMEGSMKGWKYRYVMSTA